MDATSITAIRTAAVSGLATDLLARPDAGDLAHHRRRHAGAHAPAGDAGRPARPPRARVQRAGRERRGVRGARGAATGLPVEAVATAEEAVAGADLSARRRRPRSPSCCGAWVAPGAHVNAVGAYTPTTRELDSELVARARLYADKRESLLSEAGEFLIPKGEGLIGDDHIVGEIGEVLTGKAPARTSPDEITLFKSLGIAIEDLASAHRIYEICKERELGTWVEIGGLHFGKAVEG